MTDFDDTALAPDVTDVAMTEALAYSASQGQPVVEYVEPETSSWLRQHWRTAVAVASEILAVASFIWVVTHVPNPPEVITLPAPAPSTETTVIERPFPLPTQQAPPAEQPPPVTVQAPPTQIPVRPPVEEPTKTPEPELFSPADDQKLATRLESQSIPVNDAVINVAHDACIMIQDGHYPSEVDREVTTKTDLDLHTASMIVADAQLTYQRCFRGGDRR